MRRVLLPLVLVAVVSGCHDEGSGAGTAPPPEDFTTRIDNPYWPMAPGRRWTYSETDAEGTRQTVVVTVSDRTKKVASGVTARVVRDTVSEDGRIVEDTVDWYAQDREGNVWYLGERTAEFEGGRIVSRAGSWEAGLDGARAGIMIPARPRPGQRYREEYLKGEAEDRGEVLSTEETVEGPTGRYRNALLVKDTTPLDPTIQEYKLYARGVGPVLVLGVSGGPFARETLVRMDRADAAWTRAAGTAPLGEPPGDYQR